MIFMAIIFWLLKFEKKLKIQWPEAMLVSLTHVVVGWSCMWLLALAEVGFAVEKAANMRLYGAIFVLPFLYYAWAKKTGRDVALVMDISAICVIFGAISGRLNCLTKGCCHGVTGFLSETTRWPIREIEFVFYIVFIIYYFSKIGTKKTYGQVYPMYLIFYGAIRFLCEFIREEYTTNVGIFHLAHVWSLLAIAAGILWLCLVKNHSGKKSKLHHSSK